MDQDKNLSRSNIIKFLHIVLMLLILITSFNAKTEKTLVFATTLVWASLMIFSLHSPYKRVMLIMFLISFFNFLMGRSLLITYGTYEEVYKFTEIESINGQRLVLFSLVVLGISYLMYDIIDDIKNNTLKKESYKSQEYDKNAPVINKNNRIKVISKKMFLILYPFLIASTVVVIIYVVNNGYASIYKENSVEVPFLIKKLGDLSIVFFWIYLGTLPSKEEIKLPIILWILYLGLTLGIGARSDFVVGFMMTFTYLFIRNKVKSKQKWIEKKDLIFIFVFGIISLIGLSIYNDTRFSYKTESKGAFEYVTKFFYDQGINVNNNKRIFKYSDSLSENRYYSFKKTKSFIDRNINKRILKKPYLSGNSIEMAINTNSLEDALSLLVLGEDKYLSGHGVGSSYIAEVFLDFSWIGLIIINNIYALILYKMNKNIIYNKELSSYSFAIIFLLFGSILRVPRSNADLMIPQIINPMFWLSVFIIEILIKSKDKMKDENQRKIGF